MPLQSYTGGHPRLGVPSLSTCHLAFLQAHYNMNLFPLTDFHQTAHSPVHADMREVHDRLMPLCRFGWALSRALSASHQNVDELNLIASDWIEVKVSEAKAPKAAELQPSSRMTVKAGTIKFSMLRVSPHGALLLSAMPTSSTARDL